MMELWVMLFFMYFLFFYNKYLENFNHYQIIQVYVLQGVIPDNEGAIIIEKFESPHFSSQE